MLLLARRNRGAGVWAVPPVRCTLAATFACLGILATPALAQAENSPAITLSVQSSSHVLYGSKATVTLSAENPAGQPYGYNLSYRAVLPTGVSFVAGSTHSGSGGTVPAPTVISNEPSAGKTTLIWSNVGDLSPSSHDTLSFEITPSTVAYTVGSSFLVEAGAYIAKEPRYLPKFSAAGVPEGPEAHSFTGDATGSASSTITAIEVSQSSASGAILRGVHDHQTVYKLTVTNNSVRSTTNVTLDDWLPAALEYLGCGGAGSDHTTDAPTNLGSTEEYPGSGPIEVASLVGCTAPELVDTVEAEPDSGGGDGKGVYTHLHWSLGTIEAGQTRTFEFRAAVPIRENTLTWTGTKPTGASGHQATNLDNNSGKETRDGESITTFAETAGKFEGVTSVSSSDTLTRVAKDITTEKSASTNVLADGEVTKWTIVLHSSEYRYNTAITVTDTLPSGLCPLSSTNLTSSSECEPNGDLPSSPYAAAVEETNGTWTLVWNESTDAALAKVDQNASTTITFYSKTRTHYQSGHSQSGPILANDTVTNEALADATTNVVCNGDTGCSTGSTEHINHERPLSEPISASASASQTAEGPTIAKKIAASGTECLSDSYTTSTPVYHPGDLVCWLVEASFPSALSTHGSVVTDFLPGSVIFDEAFNSGAGEAATASDTLPTTSFSDSEAGHEELGGVLKWTLPESGFVGDGGQRLERVFATTAKLPTSATPGDLQGNLMKFASINTPGESFALRAEANYELQFPDLSVAKKVVKLAGTSIAPTSSATVKGSEEAEFALTISNSGELAAKHVEVWDEQPTGLPCEDIVSVSNGGACAGGRITWGETGIGESEISVASKGETVLHFTAKVPANINPGTTLTDHAGVVKYQSETNTGSFYTYIPKENLDAILDSEANMPAANSEATLKTENVTFEKKNTTSVVETGNTAAQATIGEQVTYEVSVTIPAGTTLSGRAKLSDPTIPEASPQRLEYAPGSEEALVNGSPAVGEFTSEEPSGSPVLLLPEDYEAPSTESRKVTMRFKVHVTNAAKNFAGGASSEKKVKNTGKLAWTNPLAGAQTREASVEVSLVEPSITLTQTNNSGGPVHGGQAVEYKLEETNAAGASGAYTNKIVDTVPSGLIPTKEHGETLGNGESTESGGVWNEGARTITWEPAAKLEGGHSQAYKFFTKVVNEPVAASQLKNTAIATAASLLVSEYPLARTAANAPTTESKRRYESSTEASLEVQGATLAKSSDSPTATIGHRVTYTLTVTLPAHVVAYNETVIDTLPDTLDFDEYVGAECTSGCPPEVEVHTYKPHIMAANTTVAWYLGNLPETSAPRTVRLTYRASVRSTHRNGGAKIEAGAEIKNAAVLYYNQSEKGSFAEETIPAPESFDKKTATQSATTTIVEPTLTLVKEASVNGGPYRAAHATLTDGDSVAYRLSVKNTGTSPAYDVAVTDKPSSKLEAATPTEGSGDVTKNEAGEIDWSVPGPIAVGETVKLGYSAKLVAVTKLKPGEEVDNEAKVPSYFGVEEAERNAGHQNYAAEAILYREYGGLAAQVTASVELPAISIEKTTGASGFPSSANAEVGQPFKWRVVVKNTSAVSATSVAVTDHLPANWEYVAHSASFAPGGALESTESGSLASGRELRWQTSIELAAGQSTVLTYEAKPTLAAETDPGSGAGHPNENSASATVKDAQGNPEDESGPFEAGPQSASAVLILPQLEISKVPVRATVNAGEADSYHVVVHNSGAGAAREVRVADTLPVGMTYAPGSASANPSAGFSEKAATSSSATWAIESIAPGASVEITVPVDTAATLASATRLTNEVAAHSSEETTPVEASGTIETTTSADLEAHKRIASAGGAVPGRQMTYEVGLTDNGPSVAHGAKLVDHLPASVSYVSATEPGCNESAGTVTCEDAELAPGATKSFQIVVAVPSSATGTIENTVVASSETPDSEPAHNEASVEAETEPKAALKLEKTALTPEVLDGQQARFKLVVTNDGPSDAEGAKVVDTLPAGLTYVSASGASCTDVGQEVTCPLGTLADGAKATVELVVTAHGVGTDDNRATASSEAEDPEPSSASAEASVEVLPAAQLKLEKSVSPTLVQLPGEATYTLTVENEGPDAAKNVVVTDPLPTGITYASDDAGCTLASQKVKCELGELANTASRTIHLHTHVAVTIGEQLVTNTAEVSSSTGNPEPADARSSAQLRTGPAADVAVVKSGPASVLSGAQIKWSLAVTNHGPSTAHNVKVVDPLPAGVSYVGSSASQGACTIAAGALTCELGTLTNGASAQISVAGTVTAATGTLSNTATVNAEEPDPEPANNASTALTQVTDPPPVAAPATRAGVDPAEDSLARTRVTLRKLVNRAVATPGERLSYRLIVRNAGRASARGLRVCDAVPAQTTVVSRGGGHLDEGRICFKLGTLRVGKRHTFALVLRVDSTARGFVVNRATVSGDNFASARAHAATRVRAVEKPRREGAVTG